jgi:CRP-like cAMP-binding protein
MYIVDDPMLALITRFMGDTQHLNVSDAEFLLRQITAMAGAPVSGPVDIELPASKHIIASRLNLTPETLSRVLHSLSESGLIRVNGKRITVLDATRLSQFDGTLRPPCATHLPQSGQRL